MPAGWKGDLLLSKRFDFVSDDIDSSMRGILVTKEHRFPQARTFRQKR